MSPRILCAQALVSFLTRPVAMYATVSWPRFPQAYALVPKSDNRVKKVYMLKTVSVETGMAKLGTSKHDSSSVSLIFHADHLGLCHGSGMQLQVFIVPNIPIGQGEVLFHLHSTSRHWALIDLLYEAGSKY